MKFSWRAHSAAGKVQRGIVEADDARQARQKLRAQGLQPISMRAVSSPFRLLAGNGTRRLRLPAAEVALFTRQLATLANAALPLEEAIGVIARQSQNEKLRHVLTEIRARVTEGHPLAETLAAWPRIFDPVYRTLVMAGEKSGTLGPVLEKLADYNEIRQRLKSKMTQAMIYPMVLTSVAIIVITILLSTVVPKVVEQFIHMKHQLPLSTRILLAVSDAIRDYGLLVVALIGVALVSLNIWLRKPENRFRFHALLLRLPLGRRLVLETNSARYLRTLSILQASGVPLLEGMHTALEGISNLAIRDRLSRAGEHVRQGSALHTALSESELFSPMMLYMLASGEKSGHLSNMMERAATAQEQALQNRMSLVLALFEPGLVISMAVIVLFIMVSILQPILQLNNLAG